MNLLFFFFLLSSVPPNYTDVFDTREVIKGENFLLLLNLEARPAVTAFNFTKDGVPYSGDISPTRLNISDVSRADAGVYNVTASNTLGSASFAFTLIVFCEF